MTIKKAAFLTVWCLVFFGLCGCTAPLAMQGLSSSSPVAFSYIGRGKGESAWLALFDDVVKATQRAGQALSFKLEKKKIEKDQTVFNYVDGKGKRLDIMIERRTETLTYARFDVGTFGSRSIGRLMARQIIFEMTEAGAFLRNWSPTEDDSSGN